MSERAGSVRHLVLLVAAAAVVAILSYVIIVVLGVGYGPTHGTP